MDSFSVAMGYLTFPIFLEPLQNADRSELLSGKIQSSIMQA
jgi:hypothetical protein